MYVHVLHHKWGLYPGDRHPYSVLSAIVSQTVSTYLSSLNLQPSRFCIALKTCKMQKQNVFRAVLTILMEQKSRFLKPSLRRSLYTDIACIDMFRLHGRQSSRTSCRFSTASTFYRSEVFHSEKLNKLVICRMTTVYNFYWIK